MQYISITVSQTKKIASQFISSIIERYPVICVSGDLGSGKTQFVKGICSYFGIPEDNVVSPSFVIRRDYHTDKKDIFHFDLYRFTEKNMGKKDLEEILSSVGFYDVINTGIIIVEWGDEFKDIISFTHHVKIRKGKDENIRYIDILKS